MGIRTTLFSLLLLQRMRCSFVPKVDMVWNLMFVRLTSDHSKYINVKVIASCLFRLILIEFMVIMRVVFVASMYLLLNFLVLVTIRFWSKSLIGCFVRDK